MPGSTAQKLVGFWRYWIVDVLVGARLWLLHEGLRLLPTDMLSRIGGIIARVAGPRLYGAATARARATLTALRGDLASAEAPLSAALSRAWDCIGRTHAEFSAEDRLFAESRVHVVGAEFLDQAREGGRPLIVAGLHLGNWELLPITLGTFRCRVIDVYQPQPNRFVDHIAMTSRMRAARAIAILTHTKVQDIFRLVPPSPHAGTELVRAIRSGWTLMMYVDEEVRGKVRVPAFGRAPPTDGNLARVIRLARLTGAAIVPAYCERMDGARFTVHFLPPLTAKTTPDGAAAIDIAELNAAIAEPVRRHLDQWFMLLSYRMKT